MSTLISRLGAFVSEFRFAKGTKTESPTSLACSSRELYYGELLQFRIFSNDLEVGF